MLHVESHCRRIPLLALSGGFSMEVMQTEFEFDFELHADDVIGEFRASEAH